MSSGGILARFERRVETMVNRPFAKAFRAEVQPVEIAAALQRECDDKAAIVAKGRTLAPNAYVVELGTHDYERLAAYEQPLTSELASMVDEHVAAQRYSLLGPTSVRLTHVDDLDTGMLRVRGEGHAQASSGTRRAPAPATEQQPTAPQPADETWLELGATLVPLGRSVVIGRSPDAGLRLDAPEVSRQHAKVERMGDADILTDLGSTNGVLVNGSRVREVALHDGDSLTIGTTTIVYRRRDRR